jgi:hypothetical protein
MQHGSIIRRIEMATISWMRRQTIVWVVGLALLTVRGVAGEEPTFFPDLTRIYVPRGTSQLLKPYLVEPEDSSAGYRLVVETPHYLQFVAIEPSVGDPPRQVSSEPGPTRDGTAYDRHVLEYDAYPSQGFELSVCWADAQGKTLSYQPAITRGGTHDWLHVEGRITSPPGARKARPLIIKHAGRGIRGTFWVDNVVFRRADRKENLLAAGTFDEPLWKSDLLKRESKDGSRCAKFVCPPDMAGRQQALWLDPKREAFAVEPATEYVVELDLKAEGVRIDGVQHIATLLFHAAQDAPEGVSRVFTSASGSGKPFRAGRATELVILPPLKDVRPKKVRIAPCLYTVAYSEPRVNEAVADNVWRSGITWTYGSVHNDIVRLLAPRGHQVWLGKPGSPFEAYGKASEVLNQHPELRAVGYDGKPVKESLFCPTWLLSSEGAQTRRVLEDEFVELVQRDGYSAVDWDIEQPVCWPSHDGKSIAGFCVCPRCRGAFRKREGLAAEVDAQSLATKHKDAWVHFRCQQNADLVGHMQTALKRCGRRVELSVYSGYQSAQAQAQYGVDWSLLAPHIDLAIAGYSAPRSRVQTTCEALGAVPFIGGQMWYLAAKPIPPSAPWMVASLKAVPNPLSWRNRLLQQFVDGGCRGVLIWYLLSMDGGAFYYTSEAAEIIAAYEDLFTTGKRCDAAFRIDGAKPEYWAAFELGRQRLLLLMNPTAKPLTCEVEQPSLQGSWDVRVHNQASPGNLKASQFTMPLEPWGTCVVVFSQR